MAISADVYATALQEQMKGLSETFMLWHPLLEKIVTNGNIKTDTLQGPFRDFTIVQGGPGKVTTIYGGSEVISGGRTQQGKRGNTFAGRMIYHFDTPLKDLAYANGAQDLAQLLKNYPEASVGDLHERISTQLACGTGVDVGAFATLFGGEGAGSVTFNPEGVARNGFLQSDTVANQTATIHNLAAQSHATDGTTGWYNQFEDISGFSTDGLRLLRKAYYAASRQGKVGGPVDLMFADEQSYLNLLDELTDSVRISSVSKGDFVPSNIREGIEFLDATLWLEDAIDLSNANYALGAGNASGGLIYGLKSSTWFAYNVGHGGEETKGAFSWRKPFRLPEQDMLRTEMVLHQGLYCNQRRANFVVCGGATA